MDAQIIEPLKRLEAGQKAEEAGVSKDTLHAGMPSTAAWGRGARGEASARGECAVEGLKRLVAELNLDKDALQSMIPKNHLGS